MRSALRAVAAAGSLPKGVVPDVSELDASQTVEKVLIDLGTRDDKFRIRPKDPIRQFHYDVYWCSFAQRVGVVQNRNRFWRFWRFSFRCKQKQEI